MLNISYLWETRVSKNQGENQQVLKQGIVSAIEYQGPHQGYALGIEDMFVVGPKYGTNIDDLVKSRHSGGNRSPENF